MHINNKIKDGFFMSLFVISDTHLSFTTDKPMEIFGARWNNYTLKLAQSWRRYVGVMDTIVIGGDISWAMNFEEAYPDLKFLNDLPGKKIICRGNHDYWWSTMKKMNRFFREENSLSNIKFLYNNAFETDDFIICGSRGWYMDSGLAPAGADYRKIMLRESLRLEMSICEGEKIRRRDSNEKEIIAFLHFPPVFNGYKCAEIIEVLKKHGIKRCYYGHIHNCYDIPPSVFYDEIEFIITSADYLDFNPVIIEPS